MPLIKDKDRYKKLSRRDRLPSNRTDYPNKIVNKDLREKQQATENRKSEALLSSNSPRLNFSKPAAGVVTNILTLSPGESLLNIVLCNLTGGTVCDIHWSYDSIDKLTFTVTGGMITAVSGGTTIRLMADTMNGGETISLASVLASTLITGHGKSVVRSSFEPPSSMFANVEKTVYFYMSVSAKEIDVTYATS